MPVASSVTGSRLISRSGGGSSSISSSSGRAAVVPATIKTAPESPSACRGSRFAATSTSSRRSSCDSIISSSRSGSAQAARRGSCQQPPTPADRRGASSSVRAADATQAGTGSAAPGNDDDDLGHPAHTLRQRNERRQSVQALIAMFNPGSSSHEPCAGVDGSEAKPTGPGVGIVKASLVAALAKDDAARSSSSSSSPAAGRALPAAAAAASAAAALSALSASTPSASSSSSSSNVRPGCVAAGAAPATAQRQTRAFGAIAAAAASTSSSPALSGRAPVQQLQQPPLRQQQPPPPPVTVPKPAVKPRPATSEPRPFQQQSQQSVLAATKTTGIAAKTGAVAVPRSGQQQQQQLQAKGGGPGGPLPRTALPSRTGAAAPLPRAALFSAASAAVPAKAREWPASGPALPGCTESENVLQPALASPVPEAAVGGVGCAAAAEMGHREPQQSSAVAGSQRRQQHSASEPTGDDDRVASGGSPAKLQEAKQQQPKQQLPKSEPCGGDLADATATLVSAGCLRPPIVGSAAAVKLRPTVPRVDGIDGGQSTKTVAQGDFSTFRTSDVAAVGPEAVMASTVTVSHCTGGPSSLSSSSAAAAEAIVATPLTQAPRYSRQRSSKKSGKRQSAAVVGRRNSAQLGRLVARGARKKEQQQQQAYEVGQAADVSDIVAGLEPELAVPPRPHHQLLQKQQTSHTANALAVVRRPTQLPPPAPLAQPQLGSAAVAAEGPGLSSLDRAAGSSGGGELLQLSCCPAAQSCGGESTRGQQLQLQKRSSLLPPPAETTEKGAVAAAAQSRIAGCHVDSRCGDGAAAATQHSSASAVVPNGHPAEQPRRAAWPNVDLGGSSSSRLPGCDGGSSAGGGSRAPARTAGDGCCQLEKPQADERLRPQQQQPPPPEEGDEFLGHGLTDYQWSLVDSVLAATGLALPGSPSPQPPSTAVRAHPADATGTVRCCVADSESNADEDWESDAELSESSHSHTSSGCVTAGSTTGLAAVSASQASLPSQQQQQHTSYTMRRCPPKPPKASLASRARLTAARIRHRLKLRRQQQLHRTASHLSAASSPTGAHSAGARLQAFFGAGGVQRFFRRLAAATASGMARASSGRSADRTSVLLPPAPAPAAPVTASNHRASRSAEASAAAAATAAAATAAPPTPEPRASAATHAQELSAHVAMKAAIVTSAAATTPCTSWSGPLSPSVVGHGRTTADQQPPPPVPPLRRSFASSSVPELAPAAERPPQLPARTTSLTSRQLQPLAVRASFPELSSAAEPGAHSRPLACSLSVELGRHMASAAAAAAAAADGLDTAAPSPDAPDQPPSPTADAPPPPIRRVKLTTTRRRLRHTTTPVLDVDSLLSLPASSSSASAAVEAPARLHRDVDDDVAASAAPPGVEHDAGLRRAAGALAAELRAAPAATAVKAAARVRTPVASPRLVKKDAASADGGPVATAAEDCRSDGAASPQLPRPVPAALPCDRYAATGASPSSSPPLPSSVGDARRQCSTSSHGSSASSSSTTSGYHSACELSLPAPDRLAAAAASLQLTDADLVVTATTDDCSPTDEYDDCGEPLYQTLPELSSAGSERAAAADALSGAADAGTGLTGQQQQQPSAAAVQPVIVLREPMALPQRWCDMPQVKDCGVLDDMSATETKLQEAMFELLTSEASYLQGLDVLVNVFFNSAALNDESVLPQQARRTLFCNLNDIHEVSHRLYEDLDRHWQENIVMFDVCDILARYVNDKRLDVYIKYCSNQMQQREVVESLRSSSPRFVDAVRELERHPSCRNLNLSSYLLLPMQRITRYPLLVDAIVRRLEVNTQHEFSARRCYGALKEIVRKCNEVARLMEQAKQLVELEKQLRFTKVKKVPIVSASRRLIKKADMSLYMDDGSRARVAGTLTSRILAAAGTKNVARTLFLFSDLVLIAKKKSGEVYSVVDYASRAAVTVDLPHASGSFALPPMSDGSSPASRQLSSAASPAAGATSNSTAAVQHAMLLVLLQNHQKKHTEYVLGCQSESERERWIEALAPASPYADDERIYESWDCPQVQAIHDYVTDQADELPLHIGDVVNVNRKMNDGWYEGERISDGSHGWFPSSCTEELPSEHRRVKHLKQRYEVLKAAAMKVKASQAGDPAPAAAAASTAAGRKLTAAASAAAHTAEP